MSVTCDPIRPDRTRWVVSRSRVFRHATLSEYADNAPRLRSPSTPGEQNILVVMQDSPGSDGVENRPTGTAVGEADDLSSESKFSLADFDKCEKHNQHDLFVT